MNRRTLITSAVPLVLGGPVLAAAWREPSSTASVPGGVDAAAQTFLASGNGVGLSIAAMRGGELLFARGYGTANLETGTPVTPVTVFRAGSITKQFTAAALMRLVEKGMLDLDALAAKYIPEMESMGAITVRMLLHQVSGLHNYSGPDFAQQQRIDRTPKEMLDYILAQPKPMDFAPGERFEYSNSNYFVLGVIAERVSGRTLPELLGDLAQAANLEQTAADRATDIVPHRSGGYSLMDGKVGQFRNAEYFSLDNAGGAGVLRSTPTDLVQWHQALFAGRVVQDSSVRQMLATGKLSGGQPVLRDDAPIAQGKPAYGFGLEVGMFDGLGAIGHGGAVPGYTAYVVTFPEKQLSIAVMINIDPNRQMPFAEILRAVLGSPSRRGG